MINNELGNVKSTEMVEYMHNKVTTVITSCVLVSFGSRNDTNAC